MDDAWSQLNAYAERGDQGAFARVVEAHLGLVYSAAHRTLGNASAAEEVTQNVFILLAEKAPQLRPKGALSVWLYRAACLLAKKHRHREITRRQRESQIREMNDAFANDPDNDLDWERVAPLLDEAIDALSDADRTAIVLRYFQKRPLREVGQTLGVSEDAARKRVARSLDKLRQWLTLKGVTCSAVALGTAIGVHSVQAVPQTLTVASIQSAVLNAGMSTAPSFITVMASTKGLFVSALVLGAMVPISMSMWQRQETDPPPVTVSEPVAETSTLTLPDAAASGLIAEWETLLAEHGPSNGSLASVYEVIKGMDDDFRRRAFRGALITEWVERDPSAALAYLRAHDSGRVTQCLRVWLHTDPDNAIAAMLADGDGLKVSVKSLIREVAELAPDAVPELAQHVKNTSSWSSPVREAFTELSERDASGALAKCEALTGPQRTEALQGIAEGWARVNGPEALAWAQSLDESDDAKGSVMRRLLVGWAKADPAAALDRIELAPPGGDAMEFANDTGGQVLRAAAEADFDATLAWLGDNVGKLGHEALGGLSREVGKRLKEDPIGMLDTIRDHPAHADLMPALNSQLLNEGYAQRDAVWQWLRGQDDSEMVKEVRSRLMRSAAWKEPQVAIAWLEERPDLFNDQERRQLVGNMFNGGRNLGLIEPLIDEAPDAIGQMMLEHSYAYLDQDRLTTNLDTWIDRMDRLPPDKRPMASARIASAMANTDPREAIAWADTLVEPGESQAALTEAVSTWADTDSFECSQWIAELPEGTRRDHATSSLIERIVSAEPDSAWQWAKTIAEPDLRASALSLSYKKMHEQDPQLAESWLSDSGLSQADVTQLTSGGN